MADRRKRRTRQHVIADIGAKHVEYLAAKAGLTTLSVPMGADYGIDLTLNTFDANGFIENEAVRIQVKAAERLGPLKKSGTIAFRLLTGDLHHWLQELFPVILVLYDSSADVAYWEYIQRYFESLAGFSLKGMRPATTIHINPRHVLTIEAIKEFAKFKRSVIEQAGGKVSHV